MRKGLIGILICSIASLCYTAKADVAKDVGEHSSASKYDVAPTPVALTASAYGSCDVAVYGDCPVIVEDQAVMALPVPVRISFNGQSTSKAVGFTNRRCEYGVGLCYNPALVKRKIVAYKALPIIPGLRGC